MSDVEFYTKNLLACVHNLIGVIENKQWERLDKKTWALKDACTKLKIHSQVESKEDNKAFGEWISVDERLPEIGEDGESENVLCLGFKRSREGTETYEIMRWVKLTKPDMLDYKGKPIEYGWSNRWWNTNPDGVEVHYWKPLSSPGPINWT